MIKFLVAENEKLTCIHEHLLILMVKQTQILVLFDDGYETGGAELHDKLWSGHPCPAEMCNNFCHVDGLICDVTYKEINYMLHPIQW